MDNGYMFIDIFIETYIFIWMKRWIAIKSYACRLSYRSR